MRFSYSIKIPGESDNVVLEQFNLRALVNSEQDGFGNNWELEEFNSSYADGSSHQQCFNSKEQNLIFIKMIIT